MLAWGFSYLIKPHILYVIVVFKLWFINIPDTAKLFYSHTIISKRHHSYKFINEVTFRYRNVKINSDWIKKYEMNFTYIWSSLQSHESIWRERIHYKYIFNAFEMHLGGMYLEGIAFQMHWMHPSDSHSTASRLSQMIPAFAWPAGG